MTLNLRGRPNRSYIWKIYKFVLIFHVLNTIIGGLLKCMLPPAAARGRGGRADPKPRCRGWSQRFHQETRFCLLIYSGSLPRSLLAQYLLCGTRTSGMSLSLHPDVEQTRDYGGAPRILCRLAEHLESGLRTTDDMLTI